jgi:molybdate transport system ATP-binding protein
MEYALYMARYIDMSQLENRDVPPQIELSARLGLMGPGGPFNLDIELAIKPGTFVIFEGPSGAGKTTMLRILAGLQMPREGRVVVGGKIWCDTRNRRALPVNQRSIGFVFQDYALFPNMTVRGNLDYALGRSARAGEAMRLLDLVKLRELAEAYPSRLSGGQKQRLALIRALARRPQVLMLDEPLSALDPPMRQELQDELKRLHREFGTTTLMSSHDLIEIARLADRVVRLENGRIVRDGKFSQGGNGTLAARHLAGPDDQGFCQVLLEGKVFRLRYRDLPENLMAGMEMQVIPTELDVRHAPRTNDSDTFHETD